MAEAGISRYAWNDVRGPVTQASADPCGTASVTIIDQSIAMLPTSTQNIQKNHSLDWARPEPSLPRDQRTQIAQQRQGAERTLRAIAADVGGDIEEGFQMMSTQKIQALARAAAQLPWTSAQHVEADPILGQLVDDPGHLPLQKISSFIEMLNQMPPYPKE